MGVGVVQNLDRVSKSLFFYKHKQQPTEQAKVLQEMYLLVLAPCVALFLPKSVADNRGWHNRAEQSKRRQFRRNIQGEHRSRNHHHSTIEFHRLLRLGDASLGDFVDSPTWIQEGLPTSRNENA